MILTQELLVGLLPVQGYLAWYLGGRGWLLGKTWRREIWPLYVGLIALLAHVLWYRVVFGVALMMLAHRLGYGDRASWGKRVLVSLSLGGCLLPFGVSWWAGLLVGSLFLMGYVLSRRINDFTWAWVEALTGLAQGIALVGGLA